MNISKEEFELILNEKALIKCSEKVKELFFETITEIPEGEYSLLDVCQDLIFKHGTETRIEIPNELRRLVEIIEENDLLTDRIALLIRSGFSCDQLFLLCLICFQSEFGYSIQVLFGELMKELRSA